RSGFYLPQVLPVAIAGIVWGWILHPSYGAMNSLLRIAGAESLAHNWLGDPSYALASVMVVLIWVQVGYPVVVFMAGHQRIDPELLEAAQIDGARWRQRFTAITIHLLRPEIYVVLVTTTIAALKIFGPIYVLTRGGPGTATLVPSYFSYRSLFEQANVGYGSAISTVLTALILALTLVFLRLQARARAHGCPPPRPGAPRRADRARDRPSAHARAVPGRGAQRGQDAGGLRGARADRAAAVAEPGRRRRVLAPGRLHAQAAQQPGGE